MMFAGETLSDLSPRRKPSLDTSGTGPALLGPPFFVSDEITHLRHIGSCIEVQVEFIVKKIESYEEVSCATKAFALTAGLDFHALQLLLGLRKLQECYINTVGRCYLEIAGYLLVLSGWSVLPPSCKELRKEIQGSEVLSLHRAQPRVGGL